uniref:Uncharacterized protein n=1 Tax=Nelumbo nucifera TaxID=4432 RepID=A0A822YVV9_NELNU|nr:TPA_asm: hypothetical protein HUJ06_007318 [Nelumbo nucifera]
MSLAQAVVNKPEFKLLNTNGSCISDEGIDEVKDIFKKSPDGLGPLMRRWEGEKAMTRKRSDGKWGIELEPKLNTTWSQQGGIADYEDLIWALTCGRV